MFGFEKSRDDNRFYTIEPFLSTTDFPIFVQTLALVVFFGWIDFSPLRLQSGLTFRR